MRATIQQNLSGTALAKAVPPPYRELVQKATQPEVNYTLVLFAHAGRDVVTSLPVRRALRRMEEVAPGGLVAVGATFTAEARRLLTERGALVVQLRPAKWTDASAAGRRL